LELKGFYFSMDALMASMVLIAVTGFLISYNPDVEKEEPQKLSKLHSGSVQDVSEWNSSIKTDRSVIEQIAYYQLSGSPNQSERLCESYFSQEESYGVYLVGDGRNLICGDIEVTNSSLAVSEVQVPRVYSSGRNSLKAQMVMPY